jgi:AAA ATPase domain
MDRRHNPYAPGAGTPPPHELFGRAEIIEEIDIALDRLRSGRPSQHHMLVGLRGVGKTVLLDHIERRCEERGFVCLKLEAPESRSLPALLVPGLRAALLQLDRGQAAMSMAKRALGGLRNFASAFKLSYGEIEASISPAEPGVADSGDLESDLSDLLTMVGEAAAERKTAFILFIDELQYVPEADLGALVTALHRVNQRKHPLGIVGAGLPQLVGLFGRAKSYAERMFLFNEIGQLGEAFASEAVTVPARDEGVAFTDDAIDEILAVTERYPYFLQQWGFQAWNVAQQSPITKDDIQAATPAAIAALDASFFRMRFDRLTPKERQYLRAMAALGDHPQRSADVAARLMRSTNAAGPARDSLIRKGMIYSPEHSIVAFTVPLFGDFMRRAMAEGGE